MAGWAPHSAVMHRVWLPLGVDFVPLPGPSVSPMVIHSTGSLDPLPALEYAVIAIDGVSKGAVSVEALRPGKKIVQGAPSNVPCNTVAKTKSPCLTRVGKHAWSCPSACLFLFI